MSFQRQQRKERQAEHIPHPNQIAQQEIDDAYNSQLNAVVEEEQPEEEPVE